MNCQLRSDLTRRSHFDIVRSGEVCGRARAIYHGIAKNEQMMHLKERLQILRNYRPRITSIEVVEQSSVQALGVGGERL